MPRISPRRSTEALALELSEAGRSSHDTSVIMATMVELAQRMMMKRPTVARTSERPIWLTAKSPTRARDPRTEITSPKDVTVIEPGYELGSAHHYGPRGWRNG